MRLSQYFLPVLRETPKEAEIISHQLMLRAGMIKQQAAGSYAWLPLGYKVLSKIVRVVEEEQNRSGAIQLLMPNNMRGQTTAIFMFVTATVAAGLAPTIVASFTDFVFGDQQALGKSLMIVTTSASIVAFFVLRYSLRHLRPALEQQERENDAHNKKLADAQATPA